MSARVSLCPGDATGVSPQTMEASVEPADKQRGLGSEADEALTSLGVRFWK